MEGLFILERIDVPLLRTWRLQAGTIYLLVELAKKAGSDDDWKEAIRWSCRISTSIRLKILGREH